MAYHYRREARDGRAPPISFQNLQRATFPCGAKALVDPIKAAIAIAVVFMVLVSMMARKVMVLSDAVIDAKRIHHRRMTRHVRVSTTHSTDFPQHQKISMMSKDHAPQRRFLPSAADTGMHRKPRSPVQR